MRVLRIYHEGRNRAHRGRDRALLAQGVDVTLALPDRWPGVDDVAEVDLAVRELPVRRPGDVNRHTYDPDALRHLLREPWDLVDLHAEPFSSVVHQVLSLLPGGPAVVAYTAQNLDKRWPPPFHQWEQAALRRIAGIYPCSRQAGAVVRRRGFTGHVSVLPLGIDPATVFPGDQSLPGRVVCGLVGRMVPQKGVCEAVRAAAAVPGCLLLLVGEGPEMPRAQELATALGVEIEHHPWVDPETLGALYRRMHVVLVPSRSTPRWVEQYGRTVIEGRGCGAVVVATASGSLPEVVGDEGVLVAEGVPLGPAVRELVSDPERWTDLRTRGLEVVVPWSEVARGQLELYGAALSHAPAQRLPFGEPARLPGNLARPFALPVLRSGGPLAQGLAHVLDLPARAR